MLEKTHLSYYLKLHGGQIIRKNVQQVIFPRSRSLHTVLLHNSSIALQYSVRALDLRLFLQALLQAGDFSQARECLLGTIFLLLLLQRKAFSSSRSLLFANLQFSGMS